VKLEIEIKSKSGSESLASTLMGVLMPLETLAVSLTATGRTVAGDDRRTHARRAGTKRKKRIKRTAQATRRAFITSESLPPTRTLLHGSGWFFGSEVADCMTKFSFESNAQLPPANVKA